MPKDHAEQSANNDGRAADFAARHFRWNFAVLNLDAASFWSGLAFFDTETVLPVLLSRLGASDTLIGLTRFIQILGFTLPGLLAAHYIHGRSLHKPFLLWSCGIGRAGILSVPPLLYLYGESRPGLVLGWFFLALTLFWFTDGASAVSWFDIIAKTIPARVRGRFFGTMQMLGGLAGIAAGMIVRLVFRSPALPFPTNFALLACFWCAGVAISQICLMLVREPSGKASDDERLGFGAYIRQAVPLLRRRPLLRRLFISRVLLEGGGMALPFYVLFAQQNLGMTLQAVGSYAVARAVGKVFTGHLWGWLSDRFGPAVGLRAIGFSIVMVPLLGLVATRSGPWTLPALFFLAGAVQEGLWMVGSNALIEAVTEEERPLAVGVAGLLQSPSALYGVVGGRLAQATSYPVVFAAALMVTAAGFAVTLWLPRKLNAGNVGVREIVDP